jgi:hypothetical protein
VNLSEAQVEAIIGYLDAQDKDLKSVAGETGKKAAISRSNAIVVMCKNAEFMALMPRFEDGHVVIAWIDRLYKFWKNPSVLKITEFQEVARELGVDESGTKKILIKRLLTTKMYDDQN